MKLRLKLLSLALLPVLARAQDDGEQTLAFQSDIKRLMNVVVSHLYHHKDVFLRELTSNSGDAIEKTRLLALTDSSVLDPAPQLNISIRAYPDENKLVIADSGIGMTRDELAKNLGTIARSGTSEFLSKLDNAPASDNQGSNLIGQFGLGFYSSFLVADKVEVASKSINDKHQWVFESEADAQEFKIKKDPRGVTLGRGTEITLHLKDDAKEYLDSENLKRLITKHSTFSTTSPIYIWDYETKEVDVPLELTEEEKALDGTEDEKPRVTVKEMTVPAWVQLNAQPPLWMRDPKSISDAEYIEFYQAQYKETEEPLFWSHVKGDVGSTSFRALIYIPSNIPNDLFSRNYVDLDAVKLFVRRVFITNDLGPNWLPRWLQFVRIIIDADDLPLNVGRDSLQANKALKQIQRNLIKKTLDLFDAYASSPDAEKQAKYAEFWKIAGSPIKLGAHDDQKLRPRLMKLVRFPSSQSNATSLDDYVSRRRLGQSQIFFAASAGGTTEELAKSPFVEKIVTRGYEVLWMLEPVDEMLISSVGEWDGLKFQDVAKKGLKFGDEDENEKEDTERFQEQYKPLIEYLKKELASGVNEVAISSRLTTSPCAVIADQFSWTGNMERLMSAQASSREQDSVMNNFFKNAKKVLEINPRHPLIEGLLERVEGGDAESDEELSDTVQTLWDTALVRSGFSLRDTDNYFVRVERLLRKSIGVSEEAAVVLDGIKAAPAVEQGPVKPKTSESESEQKKPEAEWQDWGDFKQKLNKDGDASGTAEEDEQPLHDEL